MTPHLLLFLLTIDAYAAVNRFQLISIYIIVHCFSASRVCFLDL